MENEKDTNMDKVGQAMQDASRIHNMGHITNASLPICICGNVPCSCGYWVDFDNRIDKSVSHELILLNAEHEDRRRYQETSEEIDFYDTKGNYSHTETRDQWKQS